MTTEEIADRIVALPAPEKLRLAAELLEERKLEMAHALIERVYQEVTALMLLGGK